MAITTGQEQRNDRTLVRALMDPKLYDHPVDTFQLIETHISWVLLTGPFAYKIKKPVNLGFLDFSTLDRRRFYCEEELRLNRRLAAPLYLAVIPITGPITGSRHTPRLNGAGPVIDYAVKMRQFPQEAQLDRLIGQGGLRVEQLDGLAADLAAFHDRADRAPMDSPFGTPERIAKPMRENFEQVEQHFDDPARLDQVRRVKAWSDADHDAHRDEFLRRKAGGFVRECHGDLHLANMVVWENQILIFDCLEFDEHLRWIDVMSDLAFVTMDLEHRGRPDWANRLLNRYLEERGDYAGLAVLRSYQVYRAMVRAKVAVLQRRQSEDGAERDRLRALSGSYVDLAERYTRSLRPSLIITHGCSGSGKTMVSGAAAQALGAIRVRSDVERKRLFGIAPSARSGSELDEGLYTAEAGVRTYQRLADLAREILAAGYPVMIDAAFLQRAQRDLLRTVARETGIPFVILDLDAPEAVLRDRLRQRQRQSTDASEATVAVLSRQLARREPLIAEERAVAVTVRADEEIDAAAVVTELAARLNQ